MTECVVENRTLNGQWEHYSRTPEEIAKEVLQYHRHNFPSLQWRVVRRTVDVEVIAE